MVCFPTCVDDQPSSSPLPPWIFPCHSRGEDVLGLCPTLAHKTAPARARVAADAGLTDGGGLVGRAGKRARWRRKKAWEMVLESSGAMRRGFLKDVPQTKPDETAESRKRTRSISKRTPRRRFRLFSRARARSRRARGKCRCSFVSRCPRSLPPALLSPPRPSVPQSVIQRPSPRTRKSRQE